MWYGSVMATAAGGPVVIYLDQPEGRKLLADVSDGRNGCYQPILHSIFSQQTTRAGCGIQSCALLLSANAIGCHMSSSKRRIPSSTDKLPQTVSSFPPKRRKTEDSVDKTVPAKNYNPKQFSLSEKSAKQTSQSEKEVVTVSAEGGYPSSSGSFNLPYTELGLYSMPETMTITRRELVASNGLTLAEVAAILQAHGCTVWIVYSASSTVSQFRRDVIDVLSAADSCSGMILNFHRGPLSTAGDKSRKSHHSPVVAYHKAFDLVLILDTAAPVDRHFWTSVDAMYTAMLTVDHVSGKSRGYCFFVKSAS